MAWTKYQIFLAVLMVITGSLNTLATKWADMANSEGRDGVERPFNHPFLQSVGMFFGELTCLFAYKFVLCYLMARSIPEDKHPNSVRGTKDFNPFIFYIPALCDMAATSTMYVGLNLTYASSFQMLRGALIVFTGLLSVAFLKRKLKAYEWIGIFFVICGLTIVGASDLLLSKSDADGEKHDTNKVITGDILIIIAQVIAAGQMVIEEKFVQNISPLQAVGWEGFFGFVTMSLLLVPMYFIHVGNTIFNNPEGRLEDPIDGFYQITNSAQVAAGFSGTIISIAFFNFAGISVTKQLSATTRTVLDSIRTLIIWIFSLLVGWQKFSFIQLIGFAVLLVGMFLYNDVLIRPTLIKYKILKGSEPTVEAVLPEDQQPIDQPEDAKDVEDAEVSSEVPQERPAPEGATETTGANVKDSEKPTEAIA